jgi:hypothetical protein
MLSSPLSSFIYKYKLAAAAYKEVVVCYTIGVVTIDNDIRDFAKATHGHGLSLIDKIKPILKTDYR